MDPDGPALVLLIRDQLRQIAPDSIERLMALPDEWLTNQPFLAWPRQSGEIEFHEWTSAIRAGG